jgi:hypothetical protein
MVMTCVAAEAASDPWRRNMEKTVRLLLLSVMALQLMAFQPQYIINQREFIENWDRRDQYYYNTAPDAYSLWIYYQYDDESCIA